MSGQGGSTSWARAPERGNLLAMRVMCWIATALGRPAARLVLHPIATYFVLFAPESRRHARRFLSRALGRPAGVADVYRLVHTFAATVLDRVYFLRGSPALATPGVQGADQLHACLAKGRGAFLLGAHCGSFEAVGAVGRKAAGLRVAMLMYPDNARHINAVLDAIALPGHAPSVIALGRPEAMLTLRDWLDSGGLSGILGDRTLPGESRRSGHAELPFLGRPARFSDGPLRLAALLRREVFFMAGIYEGGDRYTVRFEPLADFSKPFPSAAERDARVARALRDYVVRLEALCRAHPYNWFNFHDFWGEDDAA